MKKTILLLHLFLMSVCAAQSLTPSENYIYSRTYLEPVTAEQPGAAQVQGVKYFDGLGRTTQSISIKATPSGKDLVVPMAYDASGRKTKDYLPQPADSQNGAYFPNVGESSVNAYYGIPNAYSEVAYEQSPLARVEKKAAPGADWQISGTHTQKTEQTTNAAGEVRRIRAVSTWNSSTKISDEALDTVTDDAWATGGFYNADILIRTVTRDEEDREVHVFTDPAGKQVLVRKINRKENGTTENLDTYYVYDDFENLAFVIPPKAAVAANMAQLSAKLNSLCYQYRYDKDNRLAEKKLPGKGWEYTVYDKQNRPVLAQDANLRTTTNTFGQKGWMFTKYDAYGRVLYSGFFANTATRAALQTALDNMSANALNNETRSSTPFTQGSMNIYYTKNAFPTGSMTVLSVNYYDEYPAGAPAQPDMIRGQATLKQAPTAFNSNGFSSVRNTKGLPTGSYVRNIENDSWSSAFIWYDTLGRAVGTYGNNHLGGFTSTETLLDFSGKVKESYTYHSRNSTNTEVTVKDRYVYSPQNFLLKHYQQINSNPEELLADLTYNDLGQMTNKKTGGALQSIDYTYNERGWLTGINPNDIGSLGNKLFAYRIKYNRREGAESPNNEYTDLKVKPRYNGGIAEVDWKTAYGSNEPRRRYGYVYDGTERLKAGFYQTEANPYSKEYGEILDYDLNGNITSLKRTGGLIGNTAEVMDNLVYHYNDGGNILSYLEETGSGNALSGYPLAQGSGQLISYDDNGNMTSHPDKGISKMTYNVLNLVSSITSPAASKSIAYVYASDGTKVKAASDGKVTDYLGGFQYETASGNLTTQILANEEGYFDFINNRYVYQYKDHLGNIRISYTKSANGGTELLEENNYYPLGLKHTNYNTGSTSNNNYKYLYNGKELQSSGYLDYGWRQYIPELGRWNGMDQLAESYHSFSPYAYVINNPISLIDPDGRLSQNFINQINNSSGGTTWYNTGIGFSTSGGTSMDYDGNSINWGSSHIGGVLSSIGVTYTGGGMGADIAGFIDIPGITLTGKHNQWGNSFQKEFNNYIENTSLDWYGPAGKGNWFFGTGATLSGFAGIVQSENMYTQGIRRGLSGNYQLTGRNLSQFGRMPMTNVTKPISGLAKWGGRLSGVSFGAGVVMDGIGVLNYRNNPNSPNAVHPAKAGFNTIMGYIGFKGGAYGAVISTLYFGVDAFYPGGWVGASETAARTEAYEQQMTGHPFFNNSAIKF